MFGSRFKTKKRESAQIEVDATRDPQIPRDITQTFYDNPRYAGIRVINPADIVLERVHEGQRLRQFYGEHGGEIYCDARVLDALVVKTADQGRAWLDEWFDEWGFVFFFGTHFLDCDGKQYVAYLNLTDTQPALRYVLSMNSIIETNIPAYSAFLTR